MGSFNEICKITETPIYVGDAIVGIDTTKVPNYWYHFVLRMNQPFKLHYGFYDDYGNLVNDKGKVLCQRERPEDRRDPVMFVLRDVWDEIQEWGKTDPEMAPLIQESLQKIISEAKKYNSFYNKHKKLHEEIDELKKLEPLEDFKIQMTQKDFKAFYTFVVFAKRANINLLAMPAYGVQEEDVTVLEMRGNMILRHAARAKKRQEEMKRDWEENWA